MADPHRVLYFSTQFPNLRNPSMGVFSLQRVKALHRAGCDVTVVAPLLVNPPLRLVARPIQAWTWILRQAQQLSEMQYNGIPVTYPKWICPPKKIFGWAMSNFLYLQVRTAAIQQAKIFRPDIILASWLPDAVAASKLGNELNIPVLAIADGTDINLWPEAYRGWNRVRVILNEKVAAIIFVSEALRVVGNTKGLYGIKNLVLRNAVDTSLFAPASFPHEDSVYTILAIGRLVPGKGYLILLEAFAELFHRIERPARLILIGDGLQRQALIRQAEDLGIRPYIELVDPMEQEKLVKYYQQADLFCLPSYSEGLPCVVVEAMACGKPVVATRVGGTAEVVDEQSGILVAPGDASALCEALLQAKNRAWDAEIIRKKIVMDFSWEKWAATMIQLMDAVSLIT